MALVKVSNDIMEIKIDYKAKAFVISSDIPEVLDVIATKFSASWLIKLTEILVIRPDNSDKTLEKTVNELINDRDILISGLRAKLKQFEWKNIDEIKPTELDCDDGHKLLASSIGHGYVHEMSLSDVKDKNLDVTHWMTMPKPPKGCAR